MSFSLNCGESECINEPAYLRAVEQFVIWAEQQPEVVHAANYVDVVKRLNKNMHGDDPDAYRLPDTRELSAQYQLLYELSLPFGLDLNNQVNFNKDATRVNIWLRQILTTEIIGFEQRAHQWLKNNAPELATHGTSVQMMFAVMNIRDIYSMIYGAIFALVGVTITILIAMRSVKYGLLSIVPNALPAAMALGVWGLIIGEVNGTVTLIFSITLGLVVDNTVHFISKYRRAREKGSNSETAVNYAFTSVGSALVITAVVLTAGFSLLVMSQFNINSYLGGLTAITIAIALAFDLFILPALLLYIDGERTAKKISKHHHQ